MKFILLFIYEYFLQIDVIGFYSNCLGYCKKMKFRSVLFLLIAVSSCVHAQNIYTYKDSHGKLLFTDKKQQGKSGKIIDVTYFPDSNIHSYDNWGSSNTTWVKKYSKNHSKFDAFINAAGAKHGVDPQLIKAVMHTESAFNSRATSPVGAQGLMQLMPATAKRFNVTNSFDPEQNINGGAQYLGWLLKRFKGDKMLALAAYNAGEGNVDKYKGIPPFKETQQYVKKVTASYNSKQTAGSSNITNGSRAAKPQLISTKAIQEIKIIRKDNSFGDSFSNL